jgi:hypothetical protein
MTVGLLNAYARKAAAKAKLSDLLRHASPPIPTPINSDFVDCLPLAPRRTVVSLSASRQHSILHGNDILYKRLPWRGALKILPHAGERLLWEKRALIQPSTFARPRRLPGPIAILDIRFPVSVLHSERSLDKPRYDFRRLLAERDKECRND